MSKCWMELVKFDHVALKSENIETSIQWYKEHCNAKILYQDDTWGLIEVSGGKIAFVMSAKHPPHVGIQINKATQQSHFNNKRFKPHRDGTKSCYVRDPYGNFVEFIIYPEEER